MLGRRVAFLLVLGAGIIGLLVVLALNEPDDNKMSATDGSVDGGSVDDASLATEQTSANGATSVEETPEYIASNSTCPEGLPTLDVVPVALGIELRPFLELENALALTFHEDGGGFVGQRTGEIWSFGPNGLSSQPVIDLSSDTGARDDQGLLAMTIDPSGTWLYINRTRTDRASEISAYPIDGTTVTGDAAEILVVDQPSRQHNGGDLTFGPDGYMYASFGDGGGLGDPGGNGQDPSTVLGSIIRFEPRPDEVPAAVPAPSNPFIGSDVNNEFIWVMGVRNPFRLSFDRVMGDLWVTDVGQQCLEEINILSTRDGGSNLGWNVHEGTRSFLGSTLLEHHEPVYEYRHGAGRCAIVGGYVYRGALFPELRGRYIFSDFCGGEIFALAPDATPPVLELPLTGKQVVGFSEDAEGELYVVTLSAGVFQIAPTPNP
ncbi:MAG: PQQ-dependent sugar dehydrogenase [Acidimicrobiales bacterium]